MRNTNLGEWRLKEPTEQQVILTKDICNALSLKLPYPMTRGNLSDFISENIARFKFIRSGNNRKAGKGLK